jgi:hypothetical protein
MRPHVRGSHLAPTCRGGGGPKRGGGGGSKGYSRAPRGCNRLIMPAVYINPKIDFAFKKIFDSKGSKDIIISFLNAILYNE